jgi:predicted glycoside hydrolase/deacetylase ChbG (UPF0249 family)
VPSEVVLVVNGDDFGRSPGINRGILECFDHGILTSASLMTLWPASAKAAAAALERPDLGIGLHVDLGEWAYSEGEWQCTYQRTPLDDPHAVRAEVDRQLRAFRRLLDRDPTHIDSHQHVHREEPARSILAGLATSLGIPLRHYTVGVRYRGDFFGQMTTGERRPEALSAAALVEIIGSLPSGTTELCCHPGYADDLVTTYRHERAVEIETLCDPRVRAAIDGSGIELRSFSRQTLQTQIAPARSGVAFR